MVSNPGAKAAPGAPGVRQAPPFHCGPTRKWKIEIRKGTREKPHPCKKQARQGWATQRRFSELRRGHPPSTTSRTAPVRGSESVSSNATNQELSQFECGGQVLKSNK